MTHVVLFHSVLGIRQGVLDAAARLRGAGHKVSVPDLYGGRSFDSYDPAMAFAHQDVGLAELMRRATTETSEVPDGFLAAGFSLGCVMAVHLAQKRGVCGVLMIAGAVPVSDFGHGARWPAGVPAQSHAMLDDPWREQREIDQTVADVAVGGGSIDIFDYEGRGHLFTDQSLPAEYDETATELFWSRALPFIHSCG